MANKQPTGNMPLMVGQTPGNMPLMSNQPTANMPPMISQPTANVPLTANQPTANMPLMMGQRQQPPANVLQQQQPLFGMQQNPANMQQQQPHMPPSQPMQSPTNAQPHTASSHQPHHSPMDIVQPQTQPHMSNLNRGQGSMQPLQLGTVKHTPAASLLPAGKHGMNPMMKSDRLKFTTSDDNTLLKQVQNTHLPDGRVIEVKPLIHIIEDIFKRAVPSVGSISGLETNAPTEAWEEKTLQSGFIGMLEILANVIDRISCEITCKCSGGGDAHVTAMAILNMLTSYSWDAKLALALSAFAVTYGEFWLVAQSYTTNQLAKAVAILKQLPEILEHSHMLKPQFDAIKNLIKAMVDISKCIVEFSELPTQYITGENDALFSANSHIPVAVYWTIRSILACASQLTGLTLFGREHMVSTTEAWELSSLAHKLTNMHSHLLGLLQNCHKYIDEKIHLETLHNLKILFEMTHIDNMRILKALIYHKDDLLPLVDGATKKRVNLDVLRRKMVLLLISDIDISEEEVLILEQLYSEARQHHTRHESQFEVVWLPIVDPTLPWTEGKQNKFDALQAAMPWYTVHHPSLIDRAVIQFIKEEWQFGKKPILVVLDPHGKVVCLNALYMMWIWGSMAYPFSTAREEALWREETWRLELLVDNIDPMILQWMADERRYICLYGGEDIEWIRKFTTTANAVAKAAGIDLEMVYVGKSNPKERVRRNNVTIAMEKLSHIWQDLTSMWYFWIRLESMWYSKVQLGRSVENDHVMQEIMTMLTYDSSEGGWAVFARGTAEMTRAKGAPFLTCLQEFNVWKEHVETKGFLPAMRDHLMGLQPPHHCNRLVLPGTAGKIPERIICSECGRVMEKFLMYRCCDD